MANNSIINVVDTGNPAPTRRTVDLLPTYLRTDKNTKFLTSTIDQLIQPPVIERISGYVGSTLSPNYNPSTDNYIPAANQLEGNYQLQPALVSKDTAQNIKKVIGYDDLLNQIAFEKGNIDNHDRLFKGVTYSFDPQINLDKFLNYPEYYWLPNGPDAIEITGNQIEAVSTYSLIDDPTQQLFVFNPDGITPDPLITLYRGMTYVFNVNSVHSVYFKTAISPGDQDAYLATISNNGISSGQIIFVVDNNTPDIIYYVAGDDSTIAGEFLIKDLDQNTSLDIENEIVGKQIYTSGNGVVFTNGMKIRFNGNVTPAYYNESEWVVDGVGVSITLTSWNSLSVGGQILTNLDVNFDAQPFDQFPFDNFTNIPLVPEYITINISSQDANPWSRYNRWFHKDVIAASAKANGTVETYPVNSRAKRPIIEFYPNIQLFNYGSTSFTAIDVIDNITAAAFKSVEGQSGYFVDGEQLEEGYRVIFNADEDSLVRGRVYKVTFVNIEGNQVISLIPTDDYIPPVGASVSVIRGVDNAGCNWWFNGSKWTFSQQRTKLNQAPLFDLFDENEISFSDITYYKSTFSGTRIFGYKEGTGTPDAVLGFPLAYLNVTNVGDFLFENCFNTDTFNIVDNNNIVKIWAKNNFLKVNDGLTSYVNTWVENPWINIPVIQFQVVESATNNIEITSIDNPGYATDITIDVYINNKYTRISLDYRFVSQGSQYFVFFSENLKAGDRVQFNIYTASPPNGNGFYDLALSATNNPLNGPISQFTLAEVTHSLKDIAVGFPIDLIGEFPGDSNLRDLGPVASFGTRLISHGTPVSFAQFFIGNKEHSLIDAVKKVADHYQQFKLGFIKRVTELQGTYTPAEAVDSVMLSLTTGKNSSFAYGYSDMVGFGEDAITRTYTVTDNRITAYSLIKQYDNTVLGNRCVLIYLNGTQLIVGRDYIFDAVTPVFHLLTSFKNGDVLVVKDYGNTAGCYVPPTPTKLGLYPSYIPEIFVDDTYVTPTKVIQGHDGSITVAFGDYRDDIILELETRIYNNLKAHYNKELLDINSIIPGAFRSNEYGAYDINNILVPEFLKWAGFFGIDYQTNEAFDALNSKTWNYANDAAVDLVTGLPLPGHWRSVYKWYFDTDRPHTHPWEMLGFTEKPTWWDTQYGPYPYTRGNLLLWQDLRDGRIRQGDRAGVDTLYARPKLLDIIPVDEQGKLLNLDVVNILGNINGALLDQPWKFGDQGPAETAWRRSSLWPFVVQILLALTRPSVYSAYMFDPSRIVKNKAGQYRYTVKQTLAVSRATQVVAEDIQKFIDITQLLLWGQLDINGNRILASGYSVLLIEANNQRTYGYVDQLATDLSNLDYNLFAKMGGFISKEKTRIIIDAVDPTSANPGVLLPQEDYAIYFNKSNPTNTFSASGVIVQKGTDGYVIRGYDKHRPYFRIYKPIRTNVDPVVNVGGVSVSYVTWTAGQFYQKGQYVAYANGYYVALLAHTAGNSFGGSQYFQQIPTLPSQGGVTVYGAISFESSVTLVPYGTLFPTIQAVFDVIVGYGEWLTTQGFVFDEVQQDLNEVMDWSFSGREFLYWTTQNWQPDSIITVSPFADRVKFKMTTGVVDDLENPYYEYNLYKTDGGPFPQHNYTISRQDNYFIIQTVNTTEGIFFSQFNTVQKEHAIVLNNLSLFGDIIYQIETGYRQLRININSFRTANWTGDFFSPGFIYDNAEIQDWSQYTDYQAGDIVRYSGKYYGTNKLITGAASFNFPSWSLLPGKPVPTLYPNFDYKINQFEDFYSLDIDNFDAGQEKMAQHLTGYTPRIYLDNIFNDPIAQYKFYQGYIKEKGTKNAIDKLAKASTHNLQGKITYNETWALRVGTYGGINTKRELEVALRDSKFFENPQLIKFVDNAPTVANDLTYYKSIYDLLLKPDDYNPDAVFATTSATYNSNTIKLPTAGFVHYNDIKATVYNKNSILDIANPSQLFEGDVLWLGFREDGEWDALRYTQIDAMATSAELLTGSPNQFSFTTDIQHNLAIGDLVSITRFNTGLDAIYIVVGVPDPFTFLVNTTLTSIPANTETQVGLLFKFVSSRVNKFNDIRYNPTLEHAPAGAKVWVNDKDGKWAVLEKVDNFTSTSLNGGVFQASASYGAYISATPDNSALIVSSPGYVNSSLGQGVNVDVGRAYYYSQSLVRNSNNEIVTELASINSWELNDSTKIYSDSAIPANFGAIVLYEPNDGLFITSAPNASNVKLTINTSQHVAHGVGNISGNGQNYCGLVKITNINTITNFQQTLQVIGSPNASGGSLFGHAMTVQKQAGSKILLVGAPGEVAGRVYQYTLSDTTATNVNITATNASVLYITTSTSNAQFGYSISDFGVTSDTHSVSYVAIGAPGAGTVSIYTLTNTTLRLTQLITTSAIGLDNSYGLGKKVVMSADAKFLFTSLPDYQSGNTKGAVIVSTLTNTGYVVNQIIQSPSQISGLVFGYDFAISAKNNTLVISALGDAFTRNTSFDKYSTRLDALSATPYTLDPDSSARTNIPSWDSGATTFVSVTTSSGSAYVYDQYDNYFAYGQQIESTELLSSSGFGNNVAITANQIIVGAPTSTISDVATGQVVIFTGKDNTTEVWKTIRTENDLVDLDKINRIITINDFSEEILDYVEYIDPIKGYIPGQADQELRFKSLFDPAVYSIGVTGVVVDTNINWIDEHVGELWWDLSAVKYMWYEQGDAEYRRNNWGGVFPGSTFDVYEWVGSEYLPSQWSALADTAEGLSQGISGQPKFADNSVMSVKQVYNAVSSSFTNIYYFWVKNKTVVPSATNRRMSAFEVASLISNPQAQGLQYAIVVSPNALALVNYKNSLVSDNIHLSIEMDTISNPTKIHTEWLLVEEGNPESMPNAMLEQKLIDSILGHDVLGNLVPDPSLPSRLQFGVSIRPRQSMFVNRYEAIRNIFEYANTILAKTLIKGLRSFDNLDASEEIPAPNTGLYDITVPDVATLDFIVTKFFVQAVVDIVLDSNGHISTVNILNSGFGYNADNAPYLDITGDGSGAIIRTIINSQGQISGFDIINSGDGYTTASADVRPYSVIVESDKNSNGNWALYHWNGPRQVWDKMKTQTYNTSYYWDPINWYAPSYNALQPTVTTVDSTYELDILKTLPEGNYVKVRNGGDGRYLILRRTAATNLVGTFDADWDLMVSENGTIQINNRLWNTTNSVYAFDQISSFDQTEFDQTPDTELFYIIEALRKDIFISDLKVYWNTLFFKAVKYAFSEQKNLDWVFKTAFISVTNHAGQLDQRPTYKLQDSSYYESYVNEVKPYHTKIRNFTVNYTATDYSSTLVTDFDLPSYWDQNQQRFRTVGFGNGELLVAPWNNWFTNYTYGVGSIIITNGGSGYQFAPAVQIIPAPGDLGTGATADAYISNGKVYKIIVTNPGQGYASTPTIVITGGGGPNVVVATAYPQLANNKIRSTTVTMKFDRVGFGREIGSKYFTDNYTGDGSDYRFPLTWVPTRDKGLITLTINGILQLSDSYNIVLSESPFVTNTGTSYSMIGVTGRSTTYTQEDTTYKKQFAVLELTSVPAIQSKIEITYPKDISLFTAVDRIQDYYTPLSGMPGANQLGQLMEGYEYPAVKVDTLPYGFSGGFGVLPYWSTAWDNYSPTKNYGVVLNPQNTTNNNATLLTAELQSANAEKTSLDGQIVYLNNTLGSVPQFISTSTPFGIQQVPNPFYYSLIAQLQTVQSQLGSITGQIAQLNTLLSQITDGNVAVTTPFVVNTGTTINTYLNGVRVDSIATGAVTLPIHGTGTAATVYIPIIQFNVPFGNSKPTLIPPASYDGRGHHPTAPLRNSAGSPFVRAAVNSYVDGIHQMRSDLPNARTVSNLVVKDAVNHGAQPDPNGYSGFMYAFGQLLTHDLEFARPGTGNIDVIVPAGDTELTPGSHIPVTRNAVAPNTGTDAQHPALPMNDVTGWIDASVVYGIQYPPGVPQGPTPFQNPVNLREGGAVATTGKLLTSSNGQYAPIDPDSGMFIFGDPRGTENPDLTSMQILFIREHNWHVSRLKTLNLNWTGEQLYQRARAIVIAEFQKITYSEWLPKVVGADAMPAYTGFNPNVDASISIEFAAAAMRFGHSIVSGAQDRVDEFGNITESLTLGQAFFLTPTQYERNGGADGFLRKLASDISNKLDVYIIDDLRNLLDDPPAALDLAATNIQRGRDLGLPSLNQMRTILGLTPYTAFSQITADTTVATGLQTAYTDINKIDLWIGGLAETPVAGAMVGQTFQAIMIDQFTKVRAGDSQWYENQPWTPADLAWLQGTTLSDIILRNTDTVRMQADAFVAVERVDLYNGQVPTITARPKFPDNIVVFRSETDDGTLVPTDEESLDTLISGGNFDQGVILGIGASEIVVDGDAYLSANASHAPEEMIPGEIQESVSISVFSVNPMTSSTQFLSAPVIKNYKYQLDGQTQAFNMGTIANTSSLIVVAGNTPLHFGVDYVLDITNNNLGLLQPLPGPDYLSISSFDVGGINVLDKQVVFSAARTINVLSTIAYDDIGSVYVTVNGIPVPEFTGTGNQTYGYTLSKAVGRENEINPRGYLNIVKPGVIGGINNAALNKTQVWYFDAPYKANGEIYTQVIPRAIGTQFDLEQPPGVAGPYSSQVIVELNGRRLIPPSTIYYIVGDNLSSFQLTGSGKISQFNTATSTSTVIAYPADNTNAYPPGSTIEWQIIDAQGFGLNQDIAYNRGQIDNNSFEVWLNGVKLDQTPLNYFLNSAQGIVQFPTGRLQKGDALAFVIFDNYEYQIVNNKLLLQNLSYRGNNDTIRITSFTNHNGDFIRKEKFFGSSQNTYIIQRPVFDTAYIWVEYNQKSLIADIDYTVANDGKTITVRPSYYTGPTDTVVITSMSQNAYIGSMTYRMFTDILGRTSVKRIGDNSTTALVNPLLITDTTILVEDGSVLSTPNPTKNLPGIIYVAGERIEYFAKFGNVLSQITRGTLGTGARSGYPAGTKVIDQGPGVNVPVTEKTITQTFVSTNTNTSFVLNPADTSADKIIAFNSLANPWDQVDVFYGGRRLLKPTTNTVVTFNPIAYDSNQQDSNGNLSNVVVAPEFTITNSLTTPAVQLNIDVQPGLELVVRQKVGQSMFKLSEFADPAHASQTVLRPGQEFIESVRGFLSQDTAQLPDDNYFGGDVVIILETDAVLQDEDGSPIEGN